jgi:hypothetical protein
MYSALDLRLSLQSINFGWPNVLNCTSIHESKGAMSEKVEANSLESRLSSVSENRFFIEEINCFIESYP